MKKFHRFFFPVSLLLLCLLSAYLVNLSCTDNLNSFSPSLVDTEECLTTNTDGETTSMSDYAVNQNIIQPSDFYNGCYENICSDSIVNTGTVEDNSQEGITTEQYSEPVYGTDCTAAEIGDASVVDISECTTEVSSSTPAKADDKTENEQSTENYSEISTDDSETVTENKIILNSTVVSDTSDVFKTFGNTYSDSLISSDDCNEYMFYVQERGYISFVLSHESFTGTGGWLVTVESEYYLNGVSGDTAFRIISSLICKCDLTKHKSVNIGVIPGNYKIKIVPYVKTVNNTYKLKVSFTPSADYEIECNDTISRYSELYPGKTVYGAASFADSTDTDWYLLNMYSDGVIKLKFEHDVLDLASVLWKITLFDSSGNELYSEKSFGSSKLVDSGCIGLASGNYFVKIESRVYSSLIYSLSAERITSKVYELENNDSVETATSAKLNNKIYGNSASRYTQTDSDYYKFTLTKTGVCSLTFAHDEITSDTDRKGWNITFTDSAGNTLYYAEGYYFRTKTVSGSIGLPAGVYYVCIDCDNCYRVDTDYSVLLSFEANSSYETEFNDKHSKADKLTENISISGNLIKKKSDYDKDCYSLTVSKAGKIDITFSHIITSSEKVYYSLSLFDSKGNKVTFYTSDGQMCDGTIQCSAKSKTLIISAEVPIGKYYLDVTAGDYFTDSSYTLIYKETVY